jgi:hypothetical protein
MGKVPGYRGGDLQESGVRDGGNAIDVAVVIVNELQMDNKRAEAVPSGKGRGDDQQSGQLALFADVRVDRAGYFTEILGWKGAFRPVRQYP